MTTTRPSGPPDSRLARETPRSAGHSGREGFALPAALIVMTVLFAVLHPTLKVVEQQAMIASAVEDLADEEMAAEAGYVDLLAQWEAAFFGMAVWQDTIVTRLTPDADTAYVKVTRTTDRLFLLEALEKPNPDGRVLSALTVRAGPVSVAPRAAVTSTGAVTLSDNAWVHGWDEHPGSQSSWCTAPIESDQAGVLVPDVGNVFMGPGTSVYGYPPTQGDPSLQDLSLELGDATYFDLTDIADRTINGTFTGAPAPVESGASCNEATPSNWGDPHNETTYCRDYRPVIHVKGDATLTAGARLHGILLVDGDLRIEAGANIHGVVIVRGHLDIQNGGETVRGAVFAGSMSLSGLGNSGWELRYSSCIIDNVQRDLPLFAVRPIESRSYVQVGQ